jgi:hypothetical protein
MGCHPILYPTGERHPLHHHYLDLVLPLFRCFVRKDQKEEIGGDIIRITRVKRMLLSFLHKTIDTIQQIYSEPPAARRIIKSYKPNVSK